MQNNVIKRCRDASGFPDLNAGPNVVLVRLTSDGGLVGEVTLVFRTPEGTDIGLEESTLKGCVN